MQYFSTLFWYTTLHVSDRSVDTVFTANCICYTSYVDCLLTDCLLADILLADSQYN